MEFRELTSSLVTFWGSGCAEHILTGAENTSFIRRRNNWINANIPLRLSGLLMIDWGKIVGFTIELPVEYAPLPLFGKNLATILCYWTQPAISTSNHKNMLLEQTVERLERKSYSGAVVICSNNLDIPIWESLGFETVGELEMLGSANKVMFLNFSDGSLPSFQRPKPLPSPHQRKLALDLFCPAYCPLGGLLMSKVIKQSPDFARQAELRIHDTSSREVVIRSGRVIGAYLNGKNITTKVLQNVPIIKIISDFGS
ncbi:hypothetical protein DRQ33_00515 [bacterium]|nr:MAG: hypothetical protein DRQ33_00515 [bacterium]